MNDASTLLDAAHVARSHAYAPYSKFDSGAAVRGTDGSIHHGTIVENISLGLAMCPERVALFSCATAGVRPTHLALEAPATDEGLTLPCGACLQVALELGGPELRVYASHGGDEVDAPDVFEATVGELLPKGPHRRNTGI